MARPGTVWIVGANELNNGVPEAECVVRILEAHLPNTVRQANTVALLQLWINGEDAEDQRKTGEYLVRVLDEDRLSDRKPFAPRPQSQNLVTEVVLLDAGPLGLVTNPRRSPWLSQWLHATKATMSSNPANMAKIQGTRSS